MKLHQTAVLPVREKNWLITKVRLDVLLVEKIPAAAAAGSVEEVNEHEEE